MESAEPKTVLITHEPHPELTRLTEQLSDAWRGMQAFSKEIPSRELSLAITNAQQALMWIVDCSSSMKYQVELPEPVTVSGYGEDASLDDVIDYHAAELGKISQADGVERIIRSRLNFHGIRVD